MSSCLRLALLKWKSILPKKGTVLSLGCQFLSDSKTVIWRHHHISQSKPSKALWRHQLKFYWIPSKIFLHQRRTVAWVWTSYFTCCRSIALFVCYTKSDQFIAGVRDGWLSSVLYQWQESLLVSEEISQSSFFYLSRQFLRYRMLRSNFKNKDNHKSEYSLDLPK